LNILKSGNKFIDSIRSKGWEVEAKKQFHEVERGFLSQFLDKSFNIEIRYEANYMIETLLRISNDVSTDVLELKRALNLANSAPNIMKLMTSNRVTLDEYVTLSHRFVNQFEQFIFIYLFIYLFNLLSN